MFFDLFRFISQISSALVSQIHPQGFAPQILLFSKTDHITQSLTSSPKKPMFSDHHHLPRASTRGKRHRIPHSRAAVHNAPDLHLTTTYSSDYHLQSIDRKPIYTKPKKIGTIGVRTHFQRRQNHHISDLPSPVAYTPNKHHKSKDKRSICSMEQKSSRSDVSRAVTHHWHFLPSDPLAPVSARATRASSFFLSRVDHRMEPRQPLLMSVLGLYSLLLTSANPKKKK